MNDIYGRAHVTLIAASLRTCREGFLKPKRPSVQIPYQSIHRPEINGSFTVYFTHAFSGSHEGYFMDRSMINDLENDFRFTQWARRGWTFQEDALAGARVVYGNAGVYFGRNDNFGWQRNNNYVSKHGTVGWMNQTFARSPRIKAEWHGTWEHVIRRYSNFSTSSFTNSTDVLPALSGLERLLGNELGVKYIAGHWVDNLHLSLQWRYSSHMIYRSLDDITERHGEKPHLVPTWSCLTRGGIR